MASSVNECRCGNSTGTVGAGVEGYPVLVYFGEFAIGDSVPVNDNFLEVAGEFKEFLPDPSKVVRVLISHLHARLHTGMHQAKFAHFNLVDRLLHNVEVVIIVLVHDFREVLESWPKSSEV